MRIIFSNLPKQQRQRNNVAGALNKIRNFRNRVYHYEPICWNFNATNTNYKAIIQVINWFDNDYANWTITFCDFQTTLTCQTQKLNGLGVKKVTL